VWTCPPCHREAVASAGDDAAEEDANANPVRRYFDVRAVREQWLAQDQDMTTRLRAMKATVDALRANATKISDERQDLRDDLAAAEKVMRTAKISGDRAAVWQNSTLLAVRRIKGAAAGAPPSGAAAASSLPSLPTLPTLPPLPLK